MTQQTSDHGDNSTTSYCFWATVTVLIIYLRVIFFTWISALMSPNRVYPSFSCKKCINQYCNSVCRTENIVGYMPRRWKLKDSPNNLYPGGGISACFMTWKVQGDHFRNTYEKKSWRMNPMLRNVVVTKKMLVSQELPPRQLSEDWFDAILHFFLVRPAIHISQNTQKHSQNVEKWKLYWRR